MILHKDAFIGVVYFNMEKMLLYWSVDQYNIVRKFVETVDRKEDCHCCQDGRRGLHLIKKCGITLERGNSWT